MEVSEGRKAGARVPVWPGRLSRRGTFRTFSDFFEDPADFAHVNSHYIYYLFIIYGIV